MTTITTEVLDLEHKQDTRGRRITDDSRRAAVVTGYADSGLTQKAYAKREGINYHTLVAWLGRSRRERGEPGREATQVAPVRGAAPRFAEVRLRGPSQPPAVEIVLPDGLIVRGSDPAALLTVVRELRS